MNPYQHIEKKKGLKDDDKSPFYGRFRLAFNQVYPFREPSYDRAIIKIKDDFVNEAEIIYELLTGSSNPRNHLPVWAAYRLIHLYQQKEVRHNKYIQLDFFDDEDYFFSLEMISDVIYVAMENLYFALQELSPFLEDFQFFIYSTGDQDTRWMDEYINKNGQLTYNRSFCETEIMYGRFLYYIKRTNSTPEDSQFRLFTTWQLYDRLNFMAARRSTASEEEEYKREKQFIEKCGTEKSLNEYFNILSNMFQDFITGNHTKASREFKSWCKLNQV